MNKTKKIKRFSLAFLVIFMFSNLFSFTKIKEVQAYSDVKLVSKCIVTKEEAKNWARAKGATETFINLADYYWKYSASHGNINPSIAYVQAAKETGYGKFGGVVDESYHNPCGMKTTQGGGDKDADAHQKFNSWDEGVQAHLDHMALYAGLEGYPRKETYDPRHFSYLWGTGGDTIVSMGKKWATDSAYSDKLLELYYNLLSYKTPKMNVESVDITNSGSSRYLNIKGWAINATQVKSVQVYADDKLLGNAQIGLSRSDVNNVYPDYPGSEKSGFTAKFDVTKSILKSQSIIKVVATGNDGITTSFSKTIDIEKPAPKMSIENIDMTYSGSTSYLYIRGWAVNATEVKSVQVYADNKLLGNAQIGLSRPDVKNAFPAYPGAEKSGFTAEFDMTKLAASSKATIKVVATGNDGTTTSGGKTISLVKPSPKMSLENVNMTYSGSSNYLNIRGWAINATKIKSVQVYADNKLLGNAQIGLDRYDVKTAYPDYTGAENSGFTAKIDVTKLASSSKSTIKIVATGNDGVTTSASKSISLEKPVPKMSLENISVTYSGALRYLNIKGWAINASEIKSVQVYADGKLIGNAQTGLDRYDVKTAYPAYAEAANSGFTAKLDITKSVLSSNPTIKIVANGKDGTSTVATKVLSIEKPAPKMNVENIQLSYSGSSRYLNIRGWAINATEVECVKVYVDDKLLGNAQIGQDRYDVKTAYPNYYGAEKSGFTTNINMTNSSITSNSTIKLIAVGTDGTESTSVKKLPAPKMSLEEVEISQSSGKSYLNIKGWAINATGIKLVQVYADNILLGNAQTGVGRLDVKNAYPSYFNSEYAGFIGKIDISSLAAGAKTIKVVATGNDGVITSLSKVITVTGKKKLVVVDPGHGGYDSGALSVGKTYKESDLAMSVAIKLQKQLEANGYDVYVTRTAVSPFLDLMPRADIANNLKADLFISIHFNSSGEVDASKNPVATSANGIETYYSTYKPNVKNVQADLIPLKSGKDGYTDTKPSTAGSESEKFAKAVQNNLSSYCNYTNRRYEDRGLAVTKYTNMPAVLLELGYMNNPSELARCLTEADQENKAKAITNTVKSMF